MTDNRRKGSIVRRLQAQALANAARSLCDAVAAVIVDGLTADTLKDLKINRAICLNEIGGRK